MKKYTPKEIESKWQQKWEADGTYSVDFASKKPRFVGFGMFNYPSGAGIHVGHVRNFTIPDVVTRVKRQQGFESYQPVGWDSFGMPAENFAIKTGVSPQESTKTAIQKYHDQYRAMGWAMDWQKEINTTDPEYYRWTQWCFVKLFEHGLAYQQESAQWWCDQCKTVLADEQVIAGKCWRHDGADDPMVTRRNLKQWFFRITDYADDMLEATDALDWTQSVKASQKSWIGRSKGAEVAFVVASSKGQGAGEEKLTVFTTRPDTLFGATFMVLAPEHPLVTKITTDDQQKAVDEYTIKTLQKTEVQRQQDADKEKSGVFTGGYAVNPASNEKIPIWIADYVLMGYGTGAIMAVPAHDERDYEFAQKFGLPITQVMAAEFGESLPDEQWVDGTTTVVYDKSQDRFLGLRWSDGAIGLVAGGLEEGEAYETCARREVAEEAGIHTIDKLVPLGAPVFAHYLHPVKGGNRFAKTQGYLAIVSSAEFGETSRESHEDFTPEWLDSTQLCKSIAARNQIGHWVELCDRAVQAVEAQKKGIEYVQPVLTGEGIMINSGDYDTTPSSEAREKIVADLAQKGVATEKVNYKMRDWLISRQRYWGAPIPVIHCPKDGAVAVPEKDLPVVLPEIEDYRPTGGNVSVLAGVKDWVNTTCPACGGPAKRETDTMDGYVCSSWYFLRYLDPANDQQPWNPDQANKWMPIDFYNGGDHATAHLLYARFFTRFFHKLGLVDTPEPFKKMVFNGKIKAGDGSAFSKSKGNGIDPLEVIGQGYGADAIRLYEMFAAPVELDVLWDEQGIPGSYRFLNRIWTVSQEFLAAGQEQTPELAKQILQVAIHKAIKKVTVDVEHDRFNTAIAAMMEAVNVLYKVKEKHGMQRSDAWRLALESMVQLVAPFAPHIAEELWNQLGHDDTVHVDHWPEWNEKYLVSDTMKIMVQVNGKLRGEVELLTDASEEAIIEAAKANDKVADYLAGGIKKTIYVPKKLVSFVI